MKTPAPTIGDWYKDLQSGAVFEVVAWDAAGQTVEIQHIDGEVSEVELDTWRVMLTVGIEAPEDWRTAYELDDELSGDPDLPLQSSG